MNRTRSSAAALVFALMLAGGLLADPTDEADRDRARLEKWKELPEQFARLRRHAQAFGALSPERREQLIRLDAELGRLPAAEQARLLRAMERYEQWLEGLEAKDRARVLEADRKGRLALIKEMRDREWLRSQPKATRDKVAALDDKARAELISGLRAAERAAKKEWLIAARFWSDLQKGTPMPARLTDFGKDVQLYVKEYLSFFLSDEEKARLERAEGHWPRYPITLVELADRHPPALPGPRTHQRFEDLPLEVQQKVFKGKTGKLLAKKEGPDFPKWLLASTQVKNYGLLPNELYVWHEKGLSKDMQAFVEKMFKSVLSEDEKRLLNTASGKWPDYPTAIMDVARAHNLEPPWFALPGSRKSWDLYRFKATAP